MIDALMKFLIPPKAGAPDADLYGWRIAVVSSLATLTFVTLAHMAWTVGALPFFENEGFVRAGQFAELSRDVKSARRNTLTSAILDVRIRQCQAEKPATRQFYTTKLTELLEEYRSMNNGHSFILPQCEDL